MAAMVLVAPGDVNGSQLPQKKPVKKRKNQLPQNTTAGPKLPRRFPTVISREAIWL
jgi:hypothetical protein